MDVIEYAKRQIELECQAIEAVADRLDRSFVDTISLIRGIRGKVLVTGSGTSSFIARRMAHLLSVSGTPSLFIHPMDALHGTMGAVQSSDVLIAISKGGGSDEVNDFVLAARRVGCKVVGVTENESGGLARESDVVVHLSTPKDSDPGNILAMGSTLAAAVWGDALVRTIMRLENWDLNSSLDLHPAGAVGKMAQRRKLNDE